MKILVITQIYPISPKKNRKDPRLALHDIVTQWSNTNTVDVVRLHHFSFFLSWVWRILNYPSSYVLDGIKVINGLVVKWPMGFLSTRFIKLAGQKKYDVIVAHNFESMKVAERIFTRYHIPFVSGIHNSDLKKSGLLKSRSLHSEFSRVLGRSKFIAFRSKKLSRLFLESNPEFQTKSKVMPGGVHSSWLGTKPKKFEEEKSFLRILSVSQLIRRKNIDKVIRSLSRLDSIDFTYTICGDGPQMKRLKDIVKSYNLESKVFFKGIIQREEVKHEYQTADLMVLISENETFGLTYIEAMSQGCIVVGSEGEGIDGVIVNGVNGFLCKKSEQDLVDLISDISSMSKNALRVISQRAIETAREYTIDEIADDYLRCIQSSLK